METLVIGKSKHGRVLACPNHNDKLALVFNNIIHSVSPEDFRELRLLISNLHLQYGDCCCGERRLNIKTKCSEILFSFNLIEIEELNNLLTEADFKWQIYERAHKKLN